MPDVLDQATVVRPTESLHFGFACDQKGPAGIADPDLDTSRCERKTIRLVGRASSSTGDYDSAG
jgi:hypothetical protein